MKKIVVIFIIVLSFVFCSCTADTSGYVTELVTKSWSAQLEGGGEVALSFDGDTAQLSIKSGDKSAKIEGRYVADESSFVIFVPEIAQNYVFEYTPSGDRLSLKYNKTAIEMSAD